LCPVTNIGRLDPNDEFLIIHSMNFPVSYSIDIFNFLAGMQIFGGRFFQNDEFPNININCSVAYYIKIFHLKGCKYSAADFRMRILVQHSTASSRPASLCFRSTPINVIQFSVSFLVKVVCYFCSASHYRRQVQTLTKVWNRI
jgi:hypothetical protein